MCSHVACVNVSSAPFSSAWSASTVVSIRRCLIRLVDRLALHAVGGQPCRPLSRAPTTAAPLGFFFRLAMRALFLFDQRLAIGDGNLIIVGMNFAEGEEAVAIAAVVDKRRLQRGLDPRHLGEIDIASQLSAIS